LLESVYREFRLAQFLIAKTVARLDKYSELFGASVQRRVARILLPQGRLREQAVNLYPNVPLRYFGRRRKQQANRAEL